MCLCCLLSLRNIVHTSVARYSLFVLIVILINSADDALFEHILHNPNHVLYPLLPGLNTTGYCLRQRRHDRILPSNSGCMQSNNFLTRLLYKNLYWHITYSAVSYSPIRTDIIFFIHCPIFRIFYCFFLDFCSKVRFAIS